MLRHSLYRVLAGALLLTALATGNAADGGQLRIDEQALALHLRQMQESAALFAAHRSEVAKARGSDIARIREDTAELLGNLAQSQDAWKLARDRRLELFVEVRAIAEAAAQRESSQEAQREAGRKAVEDAAGRVAVRLERLGAAAKSLATLADSGDGEDRLRFLAAFLKEVRRQVKDLEAQSEQDKQAANADSKSVAAVAAK